MVFPFALFQRVVVSNLILRTDKIRAGSDGLDTNNNVGWVELSIKKNKALGASMDYIQYN